MSDIPYVLKKNGMFYAHNSAGYVHNVLMAELYTEEYAKRHAAQVGDCEAFPITDFALSLERIPDYIERLEAMQEALSRATEETP